VQVLEELRPGDDIDPVNLEPVGARVDDVSLPDLRAALGAAGREYVRREYDWERVTARLLDALA